MPDVSGPQFDPTSSFRDWPNTFRYPTTSFLLFSLSSFHAISFFWHGSVLTSTQLLQDEPLPLLRGRTAPRSQLEDDEFCHHEELYAWADSLNELCVICQALWDSVKLAIRQSTERQVELPTDIVEEMNEALPLYEVRLSGSAVVDHFRLHFSPINESLRLIQLDVPTKSPLSLATINFKIAPCDSKTFRGDTQAL